MVIIGVEEGYRAGGLMAIRRACAEVAWLVENLWNAQNTASFGRFWRGWCGNLLFHVEHLRPVSGGATAVFHVEHFHPFVSSNPEVFQIPVDSSRRPYVMPELKQERAENNPARSLKGLEFSGGGGEW
jgi:hypothetical protein